MADNTKLRELAEDAADAPRETLSKPCQNSQRHKWTSWVYAGGLIGEHKERLAMVPDDKRGYVRDRVTALFSLDRKRNLIA